MKTDSNNILRIENKEDLINFAADFGLRENWRKPEEQNLRFEIVGSVYDNSGMWGHNFGGHFETVEKHVRIFHNERFVAEANLMNLIAIAAEPVPEREPSFAELLNQIPHQKVFKDEKVLQWLSDILSTPSVDITVKTINMECAHVHINAPGCDEVRQNMILFYMEDPEEGDHVRLSGYDIEHTLRLVNPEEAYDEIMNDLQKALCSENLADAHDKLSEYSNGTISIMEILDAACERSGSRHIDWKAMCEEGISGKDVDDLLYEAFKTDVEEGEDEGHLNAIESNMNYGSEDLFQHCVEEDELTMEQFMSLAEEILEDRVDAEKLAAAKKFAAHK